MQEYRRERNPRILARLAELGCPLSYEEVAAVAGGDIIARPHIAAVMIRKGYARSCQDAFDRYLGKGAAAYVERRRLDPAESIATLLRARAVPVLAHPAMMGARTMEGVESLVRKLVAFGLRGIEAYYHAHTADQTAAYMRLAKRHGLIVTGGTDFHGAAKPDIRIGWGMGNMRIPYAVLERLREERSKL